MHDADSHRSQAPLRASDADRESMVAFLRDHCAAGRLSMEEFGERMDRAYAALTLAELEALTSDLPRAASEAFPSQRLPAAQTRGRRGIGIPGSRAFTERVESSAAPEQVMASALARLAPLLSSCGYHLVSRDADTLIFERKVRPRWTIVAAIFLFPFGLLALLHYRRIRIVASFTETPSRRTLMTIYGSAPLSLRRAFSEIGD